MKKQNLHEKVLKEIFSLEDYERLAPYRDPAKWESLTSQDRDLLGLLFVARGERQLKSGDIKAIESFEIASKIAPRNLQVHYRQALALGSQDENIRSLLSACKALQEVVLIEPNYHGAWLFWARVLRDIGHLLAEPKYFYEANEKYTKAEQCILSSTAKQDIAICFWQWGLCWHSIALHSGEACDYHAALDKLRLAAEHGLATAAFWGDFGNIYSELALLLERYDLTYKAIEMYRNAVKVSPDYFEAWLNLAVCHQDLFEKNPSEASFKAADDLFAQAAKLHEKEFALWMQWGELYLYLGKNRHYVTELPKAFEKFAKAFALEPEHAGLLCSWAEALRYYGAHTENIEVLKEAEEKAEESVAIDCENAHAWYTYGSCLNELGHYFSDESFYYQAIEKLLTGVKVNKNNPLLWYGMSISYFSAGELFGDTSKIEQAIECCARILEIGGDIPPQFWNDWGVYYLKLAELTDQQKHIELAIDKFELAIGPQVDLEIPPNCDLEWLYNYACALDFLGDHTRDPSLYQKAVLILTRVLEQDPAYSFARYNLALALTHLGDLIDEVECVYTAVQHYEVLLSANAEDETAWNDCGIALLTLAQMVEDPQHTEESKQYYDQAEKKFLHSAALGCTRAFYNLACLHSLTGNYHAAMHFLERAENAGSLPSVEEMLHDEWLHGLRGTADFHHFITSKKLDR